MKKLSHLLKEFLDELEHTITTTASITRRKNQAAELEKAWYKYMADKENKPLASEK